MDADEAYKTAEHAVDALVKAEGATATFPFDHIWEYAQKQVPSAQRPSTAQRLVRNDRLELTGNFTSASTEKRAGSPTREYRPGSHYTGASPTAVKAAAAPSDIAGLLKQMADVLTDRGFIVKSDQLANFYIALRTSPLVILAGRSGTGKSLLPRYFSELLGAEFVLIPVQPQWADNADMLGYTPTLQPDSFHAGRLTEALTEASSQSGTLYVALLDETNLAHVEHYFSDFLSVVETRRRETGKVITDDLPLDLPPPPTGGSDPYSSLRALPIPANVRVIGTANMDETTQSFSPKVLDRAFTIEFDEVDLAAFAVPSGGGAKPVDFSPLAARLVDGSAAVSVTEVLAKADKLFTPVVAQLVEMNDILEPVGASFAYRTRDAICLYLWHWQEDKLDAIIPFEAAFDYCLLQKVLPHVRGHGDRLETALTDLIEWLRRDDTSVGSAPYRKQPYLRSAAKAERMLQRLTEVGATSFWDP